MRDGQPVQGLGDGEPPQFTRGYGLAFGQSERKAMAMALVDRALRADELGEERNGPAQDEEFVLSHSDNVEASGFVAASQAAALRRLPGRAGAAAPDCGAKRPTQRGQERGRPRAEAAE